MFSAIAEPLCRLVLVRVAGCTNILQLSHSSTYLKSFQSLSPPSILSRRLAVVTLLAQRLPIALIPEQHLISSVRHDVIDNACHAMALNAEWMRCKESRSRFTPASIIPTLSRRTSAGVNLFPLLLLVLVTSATIDEYRASRVGAWALRGVGHLTVL